MPNTALWCSILFALRSCSSNPRSKLLYIVKILSSPKVFIGPCISLACTAVTCQPVCKVIHRCFQIAGGNQPKPQAKQAAASAAKLAKTASNVKETEFREKVCLISFLCYHASLHRDISVLRFHVSPFFCAF